MFVVAFRSGSSLSHRPVVDCGSPGHCAKINKIGKMPSYFAHLNFPIAKTPRQAPWYMVGSFCPPMFNPIFLRTVEPQNTRVDIERERERFSDFVIRLGSEPESNKFYSN